MSVHFDVVSRAISTEKGTVDELIGDCIMAFSRAPVALSDHVVRKRRNVAGNASDGACQRGMADGGKTSAGRPHRVQCAGGAGWQRPLARALHPYGDGDSVNVASPLEGTNKTFGATICTTLPQNLRGVSKRSCSEGDAGRLLTVKHAGTGRRRHGWRISA